MSAMSDLCIEISERLERGEAPVEIAYALEIPVAWVYELEDRSPYATVNS